MCARYVRGCVVPTRIFASCGDKRNEEEAEVHSRRSERGHCVWDRRTYKGKRGSPREEGQLLVGYPAGSTPRKCRVRRDARRDETVCDDIPPTYRYGNGEAFSAQAVGWFRIRIDFRGNHRTYICTKAKPFLVSERYSDRLGVPIDRTVIFIPPN